MKSFLPNIDFNGAIKEQRNGEIIIWSYRTIYLFHEFVWESKYTKKCHYSTLYWCISNFFEIGDLRSYMKSRIEKVVHVNYDDTELENKGKYLVQ